MGPRPSVRYGNAAPQAPRAMNQSFPALDSLLGQLRKHETKTLYPRLALFEALATFKDKHKKGSNLETPFVMLGGTSSTRLRISVIFEREGAR